MGRGGGVEQTLHQELPPKEILEQGNIQSANAERLPWHDPIWRCTVDGVRFSLIAKRDRDAESLQWESRLLDELERAGVPASRSIRIFDGRDHIALGDIHYIARGWVDGVMLVEEEKPDLSEVGRFIGRTHDAMRSVHVGQRPEITGPLASFLSPSEEALRSLLSDEDVVRFRAFTETVRPLVTSPGDPAIVVHGDFTTRNIVVGPDGSWSLIDFGMAHVASPSVELAYAIGSARTNWDAFDYDEEKVRALIGGYAETGRSDDFDPELVVAYAWARPLLHISMLARRGGGRITTGSLGRALWLAENGPLLRGYIESAMR